MLVLEQMRFVSVVSTCEAVGNTHRRRAISDRDMRSERPGLNDPPLLPASLRGVVHTGQIGNLQINSGVPTGSSKLKPQTHDRFCA